MGCVQSMARTVEELEGSLEELREQHSALHQRYLSLSSDHAHVQADLKSCENLVLELKSQYVLRECLLSCAGVNACVAGVTLCH
jgi:chromosome segregation ATPase